MEDFGRGGEATSADEVAGLLIQLRRFEKVLGFSVREGCRVGSSGRVHSFGFRVQGFKVQGSGFRVQGLGLRISGGVGRRPALTR